MAPPAAGSAPEGAKREKAWSLSAWLSDHLGIARESEPPPHTPVCDQFVPPVAPKNAGTEYWLGDRPNSEGSVLLVGGGAIGHRPKPDFLVCTEQKIETWLAGEEKKKGDLTAKMDALERRIQFRDDRPAIYGGLGSFYSVTIQELREGKEVYFKVAAPGYKGKIDDPAVQGKILDHFRGRVFLRSNGRPDIPLEVVRVSGRDEYNGMVEHPDQTHMDKIAWNKKNAAFLKIAFRVADPASLPPLNDRELFQIVQPDREGETVLISNADDTEFSVDHAADLHVRMDDYRQKIEFVRSVLDRIEILYQRRAIDATSAARWKIGWVEYADNLVINYTEQVRAWLRWEKARYEAHQIDYVVVHGDEIDYVNDSQSMRQRPFHEENSRLLATLLNEAGIPVLIETGNHTRHRPRYFISQHPPHLRTHPEGLRFLKKGETIESAGHEVGYFARTVDAGKGLETMDYFTGIPAALTARAAGEPQVVEMETPGSSSNRFFQNAWIVLKELVGADLFDEPPERQTTDDMFRANQYLYVNSEPNFIHRYKGYTSVMTDSGAEDFRLRRYIRRILPHWMTDSAFQFVVIPFLPGLWDGVYRYLGEKEVPVKGYPDAAFASFAHYLDNQVDCALARQTGKPVDAALCATPTELTHSSHNPFFHYLEGTDNYSSNTMNDQPRRASLLLFWFFRSLYGPVIAGHIHTWEAFAYDFDLPPQKRTELAGEIHAALKHILEHGLDTSPEHYLGEFEVIWEKYELDDHLKMPDAVAKNHGQDVVALLDEFNKDPNQIRPFFVTLEAIGPTNDWDPAGVLTQTIKDGRTVRLDAHSLFFNRDGSVTEVPLALKGREVVRREEEASRTYPPRPPEPPLPAYDPYEGIFP